MIKNNRKINFSIDWRTGNIKRIVIQLIYRFNQFIKFSFIGVINTLIDFLVFSISFKLLNLNYLLCQVLGYSCGVINSFIFNKRITFNDNEKGLTNLYKFIKFICINLLSLAISMVILDICIKKLNINVYISKIIATIISQLINFFSYKYFVFKHK